MPRVIITQFVFAHSNEDALQIAREAREKGKRSYILSDEEYQEFHPLISMQDLTHWADDNNIPFRYAN